MIMNIFRFISIIIMLLIVSTLGVIILTPFIIQQLIKKIR